MDLTRRELSHSGLARGRDRAVLLAVAAQAHDAPYACVANADGDGPSNVSQFNVGAGGLLAPLSRPRWPPATCRRGRCEPGRPERLRG
jgi:hypothetical protein